jgi:hypothetical protein
MATIYFVSETWLKDNTPVHKNCDINDVVINIKPAGDMYVKPLIGSYFYNDLLTKFNNQTASANELTLIEDYIKPSMAWKAASESVLTLSYQLKSKGVQVQSGDYSSNAEDKTIMFLVHHYADKGLYYLNKLSEYLNDNKDLYSNYISNLNDDSSIKKSCGGDNYFNSGILFI